MASKERLNKSFWGLCLVLVIAMNLSCGVCTEIKVFEYRGLNAIKLENVEMKLIVLPDRGAQIASIVYKPSGREWLWQNPKPYHLPKYGDLYSKYDLSAFDDCFPTVGECRYPDGTWQGVSIPDHGEVWALPWNYRIRRNRLKLWVNGVRLPYMMEKEIRLSSNKITISYKITNYATDPLKVLWAAHPLIAIKPGMEIRFPPGTRIKGDVSPWTKKTKRQRGKCVVLVIGNPSNKLVYKTFTSRLPEGWCGFYEPRTGDFLKFLFPKEKIPYAGIWINQGGYPRGEWHLNVGLEPTNAPAETLEIADREGMIIPIPAKGTLEWDLTILAGRKNGINTNQTCIQNESISKDRSAPTPEKVSAGKI